MAKTAMIMNPMGAVRRLRGAIGNHTRLWRTNRKAQLKDGLARAEGAMRAAVARLNRTHGRTRVLVVDDLVPDPLLGAGYPRAFEVVWAMIRSGHHVDFYPMESNDRDIARMARAFEGQVRFHSGRGGAGLRRLLWKRGTLFDLLFVSRPTPMQSLLETGWTSPRTAVIYDAEAVLAPREALRLALLDTPMSHTDQETALADELSLARSADVVTAVSPRDVSMIEKVLDVPVFVVAHPVGVKANTPGFEGRRDLLFVGRLSGLASYSANVDSLRWFLTEVMPILDELIGDSYRLHVAGLLEAPELDPLISDRVVCHGVVEDLSPLYDQCRVFVAPTRFAAGIPLKVVEAMGQGIPCVATPLLGEQLRADASVLPTGESAPAFAQACQKLYTDAAAWKSVQERSATYIIQDHSQEAFEKALAGALAVAIGHHEIGSAKN